MAEFNESQNRVDVDLRTRIAAALVDWIDTHSAMELDDALADGLPLADAVIAELKLTREPITPYVGQLLYGNQNARHRYVTDWKADDE